MGGSAEPAPPPRDRHRTVFAGKAQATTARLGPVPRTPWMRLSRSESPAAFGAGQRTGRVPGASLASSDAVTITTATTAIMIVHTALTSGFTPRRTSE